MPAHMSACVLTCVLTCVDKCVDMCFMGPTTLGGPRPAGVVDGDKLTLATFVECVYGLYSYGLYSYGLYSYGLF